MRLSGWLKSTKLRRWHVSRNGSFTYLHPLAFAAAPSPFAPGTFPLLLYIPVTDINSFVSVVWRSAVAGSRCCYFHKLLLLTFFLPFSFWCWDISVPFMHSLYWLFSQRGIAISCYPSVANVRSREIFPLFLYIEVPDFFFSLSLFFTVILPMCLI